MEAHVERCRNEGNAYVSWGLDVSRQLNCEAQGGLSRPCLLVGSGGVTRAAQQSKLVTGPKLCSLILCFRSGVGKEIDSKVVRKGAIRHVITRAAIAELLCSIASA